MTATQRRFPQRYQEIGYVARQLKTLAQELELPLLVAAQLGRGADGQYPKLSDLRGSGDLEQHADTVLLLHPQHAATQDAPLTELEFILAKHRGGPTGDFPLFRDRRLRFLPLTTAEEI